MALPTSSRTDRIKLFEKTSGSKRCEVLVEVVFSELSTLLLLKVNLFKILTVDFFSFVLEFHQNDLIFREHSRVSIPHSERLFCNI